MLGLGGSAAMLAALSACSPPLPPASGKAAAVLPQDASATEKIVNWANWTDAVAAICWSGDIFMLKAETGDDNWEFVIPDSGGTLWTDNMMVPITSTHRANAMKVMDYYYQPEVAAQVAAYVN